MDAHGFVFDILLQSYRATEAARTFLSGLLGEYDVPETICTDQLRSNGAAIQKIQRLVDVNHPQVISTACCNNMIEQSHCATRRQERQQQGCKRKKRAPECLRLHARIEKLRHYSRTSVSAAIRKTNQQTAFSLLTAKLRQHNRVVLSMNRI